MQFWFYDLFEGDFDIDSLRYLVTIFYYKFRVHRQSLWVHVDMRDSSVIHRGVHVSWDFGAVASLIQVLLGS